TIRSATIRVQLFAMAFFRLFPDVLLGEIARRGGASSAKEMMMEHADSRPSAILTRLVNGYQVSQAIHVAASLGLAHLLEDGPRSAEDLAAVTGSNAAALYRLMRSLASVGVFREEGDQHFTLTPLGECLRSDASEPVGDWARFIGRAHHWQSWGNLL